MKQEQPPPWFRFMRVFSLRRVAIAPCVTRKRHLVTSGEM